MPDLAYDYTALEPHISGRIMEIYLQYQNRKTEFFEAVWNERNWQDVAARYRVARQVDVNLRDAAR